MKIRLITDRLNALMRDASVRAVDYYRQHPTQSMTFCIAGGMTLVFGFGFLVARNAIEPTSLLAVERTSQVEPVSYEDVINKTANTDNLTSRAAVVSPTFTNEPWMDALEDGENDSWDSASAMAAASEFENDAIEIESWETHTIATGEDTPILYFDGRPVRPVRTMTMTVTAYSPDARSCAPFDDGMTASGKSVWTNGMKLIAADKRFRFGSLISVPGYNGSKPTPVLDRGAAIKGDRLDLLFPTHEQARQWGRRKVTITLWDYVSDEELANASATAKANTMTNKSGA